MQESTESPGLGTLTPGQRANIGTARATILRAARGFDDVDLPRAAALLDDVLRETCGHDPSTWHTAPDADGRMLTTCYSCGISWYEHPTT